MAIKESLDSLVAAFNKGSFDVPAGFFTPHTTFTLNGRSYESMLGGSPDDPLIRLLARGAGGYRNRRESPSVRAAAAHDYYRVARRRRYLRYERRVSARRRNAARFRRAVFNPLCASGHVFGR